MSVIHYADLENGITFVDELTIGPVPSICGYGADDDFMTMDIHTVTCPDCLARAAVTR